ncbi:MAG: HAMP domain-containing histidine kinase [Deltaproteobacteria bacterium]|nr:HAMP domain-containing histidine kinase [Deltaproteobacteria bacterium]
MRLSLFSRLAIGYLSILLMVAGVSSYAILMLRQFGGLAESIVKIDNPILDHEKALADLLLGQSRAEQKYVITKDEVWYLEFVRLKNEFQAQLARASALGDAGTTASLAAIAADHRRYVEVVDGEARYLRLRTSYAQARLKADKDALVDGMLTSFENLRTDRQRAVVAKVANLASAAARARKISMTITLGCLIAILLLSLLITRSITVPIGLLKNKTREIAEGHFGVNVEVRSPPEIRELAQALNSMSEKLAALDRMKADFFASMSHELRTPLTSIKEGTGLLLEGIGGPISDKQRRLLDILAEESQRLINLVNSLLDLSKMEAGMMRYEFEVGAVEPLIKRAIAEIAPLLEAKQIQIESHLAAALPTVRLDPERLLQVLRNLLGNAVKFTPHGGAVSVSAECSSAGLEIAVKDSGMGIPQENLQSIFEKFNQGNQLNGQSRHGTELGLAITKSIILSHGGKVWAESQLGQGSRFIFILPC